MKISDLEYSECKEFTSLPDEYHQESKERLYSKKNKTKKMITLFLSFSIMAITIVNGNTQTPTIPNSPTNDIKEEPHQPIDKDPLYPIEEGTLYLTIYNDSVDPENNFQNKILAQETIPLTSFQEGFVYEMPNVQKEDGFIFMDWVVFSGNKNPNF